MTSLSLALFWLKKKQTNTLNIDGFSEFTFAADGFHKLTFADEGSKMG